MTKHLVGLAATGLIVALVGGCNGDGTGPGGNAQVVLQLATSARATGGAPMHLVAGADVLVITKVQLVARKLRLGISSSACPSNEDAQSDQASSDSPSGCPMLKLGPLLLEPPITDGAISAFTADLPAGEYDRVRLQIHKPTGNADQQFLQANPGFEGVSILVEGTWNGAPFTFTTQLTVVQEIPLEQPIQVVEGTPAQITLLLDVKSWFADQSGTGLLNPNGPSQQVRSRIEQNIRASFHAFRDKDGDGRRD